jgi:cytochrome c-type biogenesis protein CcmH/NrfF
LTKPRAAVCLAALCGALTIPAPSALATARCPRTTELALENKVMCQVCGVPLALANSVEADRERAFIITLVNQCKTTAQIEAAMVAQYGRGILATPGTHGFAITAWLVPAMCIVAAATGIAAVLLPRRRRRAQRNRTASRPASAVEEAQLDAALAAYERRL